MKELYETEMQFADVVTGNFLTVWRISRQHVRSILRCYQRYTGEVPLDRDYTALGYRDRVIVTADGKDMPRDLNVVGFLGVQQKRFHGRKWLTPNIGTFYIFPQATNHLRDKIGSLLLEYSNGINETNERIVAVSSLVSANDNAHTYLRTHGFDGRILTGDPQPEGLPEFSIGHGMQLKQELKQYIDADLSLPES